MERRNLYTIPILISFLIQACVSSYDHPGLENVKDIVVVEGMISEDSTIITLSKSVGISEMLNHTVMIESATVFVECDDGTVYRNTQYIGKGNYIVYDIKLDEAKQYRLGFIVDGKEYQSEYQKPLFTPEIDDIGFEKDIENKKVTISVSTHDPRNQSLYYRWKYEEVWEVKAELYANARFEGEGLNTHIIEHDITTSENTYFCWGRHNSDKILIGSSDKLQENLISKSKLTEEDTSHDRFSVLYYIRVKQNQIRKETYDYLSNMKKNVEQSGGLFNPIPSEIKGNVKSLSNPDERVIGFIDVSKTTYKEVFVPEEQGIYDPPIQDCEEYIINGYEDGYAIYYWTAIKWVIQSALPRCVDCRLRGTKDRPEWWPNTHY